MASDRSLRVLHGDIVANTLYFAETAVFWSESTLPPPETVPSEPEGECSRVVHRFLSVTDSIVVLLLLFGVITNASSVKVTNLIL